MLTISGGQLWNHWFGLKFRYKWACKTIQFYQNKNNNGSQVYADSKYDQFYHIHMSYVFII